MNKFSAVLMGSNIKKKIFGCVAFLMLAMGIAVSNASTAHAADGGKYEDILTFDVNKIKTIDVSAISDGEYEGYKVETQMLDDTASKISIEITESGAYKLTGSNGTDTDSDKIPDTDIKNVQFIIGTDITADLYLDGLYIFNDYYTTRITGAFGYSYATIRPFLIEGNANFCIDSDSAIYAVGPSFDAGFTGSIRMVKSKEEALLTVGLSKFPNSDDDDAGYIFANYGKIYFYDAGINFTLSDKDNNLSDIGYSISPSNYEPYFYGEGFSFGKKVSTDKAVTGIYHYKNNPNIAFSVYGGYGFAFQNITDIYGNSLVYCDDWSDESDCDCFSGFPANAEIVQIDKFLVTGAKADGKGELRHTFFPASECYIFANSTSKGLKAYKWNNDTDNFEVTDETDACKLIYEDADTHEEYMTVYVLKGDKYAFLPYSEKWVYEYLRRTDNAPITEDSTVESDTTILVKKTNKDYIDVTVDGVAKKANKGDSIASVLPEDKKDRMVIIYTEATKYNRKLVDPSNTSETLENGVCIITVSLDHSLDDENRVWFELNTADDVTEFANITNSPNTFINICGRLNADVVLDEKFPMIATDKGFEGVFDGQGHSITLNLCKVNWETAAGLFCRVGQVAEIKNVITKGFVTSGKWVGGLVGAISEKTQTDVKITNCTNYADVIASKQYYTEPSAGGIVGRSLTVSGKVVIANCSNYGKVRRTSTDENSLAGGIIGFGDTKEKECHVEIINCINADDSYIVDPTETTPEYKKTNIVKQVNCYSVKNSLKDYEKSKEAFVSGEVTYLLNQKKYDNVTWYQTCGEGYPSREGNPFTQTVYAGYNNCLDTALSFANKPFTKTVMGHELGSKATCAHRAVCKVCGKEYGELLKTHTWSDWSLKKDGTEARACTVAGCSAHETRDSEAHKNAVKLTKGISAKVSGKKVKVSWGKVTGAEGYEIYAGYCGSKFSKTPAVIVKGNKKTSYTVTKINKKAINGKKNIKIYVKAFKYSGSKRVSIGQSMEIDVVGSANKSYTNPKSVKVKSKSVKLSVGKSSTIKPTLVTDKTSKKIPTKGYVSKFRYLSSSPSVATVSTKGKIKAVKAGSATIYVYAANGKYATVKVTVK